LSSIDVSVKRRELVRYLEESGFSLIREGRKHAIISDGNKQAPNTLDRITANQICKQAGIEPKF